MKKTLNLNKFQLKNVVNSSSETVKVKKVSNQDIAIIGMAGRLPKSRDLNEFWENLCNGIDCVYQYPNERKKDIEPFLKSRGIAVEEIKYNEGAYLDEVDKFDPLYFNLTPKEASLMDPNQRLFLETAWHAIEDAGYGGKKIIGSKTGVFVGFSNDRQLDYKFMVRELEPEFSNLSVAGNIRSIIASRIAYLLDLKGPSMLVDTACSSALSALHIACSELQKGNCEMALVGGVKILLTPLNTDQKDIGIFSSNFRARTFDDSSDGTGLGEGVIAFLLKPLVKAIEDKDQIHAVIKGTGINQDGASNGITAPNSLAQANLIESVWKEANIDPETITYMEAHGTGTMLGDPIEIDGMTRAFRRYTSKKQFCAVGSLKSNIGHLDNAAGLAGVMKAVLALKNKKLPPTLHFEKPNRKINFLDSPVYVADQLQNWQTDGYPLRCGVSAFGLSGTNCHVLLEEAPEEEQRIRSEIEVNILTLSAKNKAVLLSLLEEYKYLFERNNNLNINDLCYTANIGRGHYTHRLVIIFENKAELIEKIHQLNKLSFEGVNWNGIYYGEHKIVSDKKENQVKGEIKETEKKVISNDTNRKMKEFIKGKESRFSLLKEIAESYIKGADIEWEILYHGENRLKMSLPVYPYERRRCWVMAQNVDNKNIMHNYSQKMKHPLFDFCLSESFNQDVYLTEFSIDRHWVVKEHIVNQNYIVPGTTYLEMARALARNYYKDCALELTDVTFISPLIVNEGEIKETQTIVKKDTNCLKFVVTSKLKNEDRWIKHAEGKIKEKIVSEIPKYNLNELKQKFTDEIIRDYTNEKLGAIVTGPRWKNMNSFFLGTDEILAELELPKEYQSDLREYELHPALLDIAVNAVSQSIGEGLYLPFTYKNFELYYPMPEKFYSYVRKNTKGPANLETISFDISLIDQNGEVFAQITEYIIKKVHHAENKFSQLIDKSNLYHEIVWVEQDLDGESRNFNQGKTLVLKDEKGVSAKLVQRLRETGREIVEVQIGEEYRKISENQYMIQGSEADYEKLLLELKETGLAQIVHLFTIGKDGEVTELKDLKYTQEHGVYSLFNLTRALVKHQYNQEIDIVLISDFVNEVITTEKRIRPESASLFGLGKVVGREYSNLVCRCIDIDDNAVEQIIAELNTKTNTYCVAYRSDKRYVEVFKEVDLENLSIREIELKEQGVYLITGGTGGIGLEVAKYLVSKNKINLALINRSKLPGREKWKEIIEDGSDEKLVKKLKAIMEMEETGAEICCLSVDITKIEELQPIIEELRQQYGRINGIIHSAGVAGDGFIIRKEKEVFEEVIAPKIYGTWILDHLTKEDQLDFLIMFSSISSLIGNAGQGDYTAANSYLDSFATFKRRHGKNVTTINWTAWKETGMAVDYGANKDGVIFKAINTDKAMTAFDEIFCKDKTNIIIGELNYEKFVSIIDHFPI